MRTETQNKRGTNRYIHRDIELVRERVRDWEREREDRE